MASSWARRATKGGPLCPRCGQHEKGAELIIQARGLHRDQGKLVYFGTRARRLCLDCAHELFAYLEDVLDGDP